jgi:hypothetical protein
MRRILFLAAALTLVGGLPALAGVPSPERSGCELKGSSLPCQYRFRGDGSLDCLTVCVTLRDLFDTPVASCSTTAEVTLVGGKPASGCWAAEAGGAICSCDGLTRSGVTDPNGVVSFVFCQIGGRGIGQVCVVAHCTGPVDICCEEFNFTSHDLSASCSSSTTILSMAVWVGCYPPSAPCQSSDYNCDCAVDVLDFGAWAGGLGHDCP